MVSVLPLPGLMSLTAQAAVSSWVAHPCCGLRVTLEWMGWQQQALHRASQADEVLITHVVDFNSSAVESLRQVADFVGIGRRMSDLKAVRPLALGRSRIVKD